MSTAANEKLMPVADAFVEIIGYRPPHSTISRLARSQKIKATKMLGAWYCSIGDMREYMASNTEAALSTGALQAAAAAPRTRTDAARAKSQAEAIAYLDANGIS